MGGACLAVLAVSLADVAHPAGAMEVVEASVVVNVSTVFVSGAETMSGPAVRLTGFPPPGNTETQRQHRGHFGPPGGGASIVPEPELGQWSAIR